KLREHGSGAFGHRQGLARGGRLGGGRRLAARRGTRGHGRLREQAVEVAHEVVRGERLGEDAGRLCARRALTHLVVDDAGHHQHLAHARLSSSIALATSSNSWSTPRSMVFGWLLSSFGWTGMKQNLPPRSRCEAATSARNAESPASPANSACVTRPLSNTTR